MESLLPLVLLLALTSIAGIIFRVKKGDIKKGKRLQILESEIGASYGKRASILQFSTTFALSAEPLKQ
jgi:hypothetical protein